MDRWDALLIAFAGYVAVISLVRLMAARRQEVVRDLREQIAQQRATEETDEVDRDAA